MRIADFSWRSFVTRVVTAHRNEPPKALAEEQCGTCRFWNGRAGNLDGWSGHAACHRYPPANGKHPHGGASAVFPTTQSYHWCGEWSEFDGGEPKNG